MRKLTRVLKWGPVLCPPTDYEEKATAAACEKCQYDGGADEWTQFCQSDANEYPHDPDEVEFRARMGAMERVREFYNDDVDMEISRRLGK